MKKDNEIYAFQRHQHLMTLRQVFTERAQMFQSPFTIMVYGSASYGYNQENHGGFDDMDFFLIMPQGMDFRTFLNESERLFLSGLEISEIHFRGLTDNLFDLCRMYGQVEGVKIGFRIMRCDTFENLCTKEGSVEPIRDASAPEQKRILRDREWSFSSQQYLESVYPYQLKTLNRVRIVILEQRIFSSQRDRLGMLGRKLLTATLLHDSGNLQGKFHHLWKLFVRHSCHHRRDISNDEIIASLFRSERFSTPFRQELLSIVKSIRKENLL